MQILVSQMLQRFFKYMDNDVVLYFLDTFTIIYLDDIMIYSKAQEEHDVHIHQALRRL